MFGILNGGGGRFEPNHQHYLYERLVKSPFVFLIMAIFISCEPEEMAPEQKESITVTDAQNHFDEKYGGLTSGRTDRPVQLPDQISWEDYQTLPMGNAEAIRFEVSYDDHIWAGLGEESVLSDLTEQTYVIAYKENDEVHLEVVKSLPTRDTDGFTGYVLVESWEGELLRLFEYEEGEYLGERDFQATAKESTSRISCDFGKVFELQWTVSSVDGYGSFAGPSELVEVGSAYYCVNVPDNPDPILDAGFSASGGPYEPDTPENTSCNPGHEKNEEGECVKTCENGRDENGNCKCDDGSITDSNGECMSEADMWEDENIELSEKFKNDPCLMEIWNAVTESDAAFELLKGFLEEYPSAELKIKALTTYQELFDNKMIGTYGSARNYHQEQLVYLNMLSMDEASSMFIATVLGHELIHASMYLELYENTTLIEDNGYDPQEVQENLPILYELWLKHKKINDAHHEMIAEQFQPFMNQFLQQVDISLNGSAKNQGLYDDLFWIGLEATQAYKEAIDNGTIIESDFQNIRHEQKTKGKCD